MSETPESKLLYMWFCSLIGLFIQKAFNNMELNGWAEAISTYNNWERILHSCDRVS